MICGLWPAYPAIPLHEPLWSVPYIPSASKPTGCVCPAGAGLTCKGKDCPRKAADVGPAS